MSKVQTFYADTLTEMTNVGISIAQALAFPSCVYMSGDLGAGKTSLVKSMIEYFGYTGPVTSPTYNLIQEYPVNSGTIFHLDLYRLEDPEELEYLAIRDLYQQTSIMFVEWPEQAKGQFQDATHHIKITVGEDLSRKLVLTVLS